MCARVEVFVVAATAGIHGALARKSKWIPAFAGMTV
jgi:hypothetical protein